MLLLQPREGRILKTLLRNPLGSPHRSPQGQEITPVWASFTLLLLPHSSTCSEFIIVIVQLLSHVQLFAIPWTAAHQASLSFTISRSLLRFKSIESVMLSNYLILCCPLLSLPSIFLSNRVFSNESALLIRWPKCWSFGFRVSPSKKNLGFISFRIDCFDCPCSPKDSQVFSSTTFQKHQFFCAQAS